MNVIFAFTWLTADGTKHSRGDSAAVSPSIGRELIHRGIARLAATESVEAPIAAKASSPKPRKKQRIETSDEIDAVTAEETEYNHEI
jgi:hypothetical protein